MKVNELMIGDWVYNHRMWECPILAIRREYDSNQYYAMVIARHYGEEEFRIEDLKPIPLTPKILESNGWKQYKDQDLYVQPDYRIAVEFFDGKARVMRNMVSCEYVHELQHALRLCGIEKEIIL